MRIAEEDYIELYCKGNLVDISCDLAAIKTFYWKSGDDIVLEYQRKEKYIDSPITYSTKKKNSE